MIEFSEMRGPNKIFGSFCEINEPNILFEPLISENSIVKPPLGNALLNFCLENLWKWWIIFSKGPKKCLHHFSSVSGFHWNFDKCWLFIQASQIFFFEIVAQTLCGARTLCSTLLLNGVYCSRVCQMCQKFKNPISPGGLPLIDNRDSSREQTTP